MRKLTKIDLRRIIREYILSVDEKENVKIYRFLD